MLLFIDEAPGNKQRERHVLVPGRLEPAVQRLLHVLPQRPTVGAHNHAAAHRSVVGQLRLQDQLVVPLGKILRARGKFFFSHSEVSPSCGSALGPSLLCKASKMLAVQTKKRSGRMEACQRAASPASGSVSGYQGYADLTKFPSNQKYRKPWLIV